MMTRREKELLAEREEWKVRAEKAEYEAKRWKDVAEKQASWETLWAEQVERAEAAEKALCELREQQKETAKDHYFEVARYRAALERIALYSGTYVGGTIFMATVAREALEAAKRTVFALPLREPPAPAVGDRWLNADSGTVHEWDGTTWVPAREEARGFNEQHGRLMP